MSYLFELGKTLGIIAGVITACAVIAKSPAGKVLAWIYRRLVGQPVSEFMRAQVSHVVDDKLLTRNGGTTVPDAIAAVHKVEFKVDALAVRVEAIEHKIGEAA